MMWKYLSSAFMLLVVVSSTKASLPADDKAIFEIAFDLGRPKHNFVLDGFSDPEGTHIWTLNGESSITLRTNIRGSEVNAITFENIGALTPANHNQTLIVSYEDCLGPFAKTVLFRPDTGAVDLELDLSLVMTELLTLKLSTPDHCLPGNGDPRSLAISFRGGKQKLFHQPTQYPSLKAVISQIHSGAIDAKIQAARASTDPDEKREALKQLIEWNQTLQTLTESMDFNRDRDQRFKKKINFVAADLAKFDFTLFERKHPLAVTESRKHKCDSQVARKAIFDANRQISKRGYVLDEALHKPNTQIMLERSQIIDISQIDPRSVKRAIQDHLLVHGFNPTNVLVVNQDSFDCAIELKHRGHNPLVLDLANGTTPGGGANTGYGNVQEEVCCYRSNLYCALEHIQRSQANAGKLDQGNFLPQQGGAYCPSVSVFRIFHGIGAQESYNFMPQIEEISVFASAAYRHAANAAHKKGYDAQKWPDLADEQIYWSRTRDKLRSMFFMALTNGHDALVLGAFGNGAFRNPADQTIEQYKLVLHEFRGCFKEIRFAVLCPADNTGLYRTYKKQLNHYGSY